MADYKEGDTVRVITKEETIEGILIPRPEILKGDVLVIKLDSGYNIGIDKKNIKKIELVEAYKPKKAKAEKRKPNPKLPNVSVLSTGGTISSRIDYRTGGVAADYTAEDFVEMCPELLKIANIEAKKVMTLMSEDITPNDWKEIAKILTTELNKKDVEGVVITMGTDVLHYVAAAISFMLKNISKPVIFTAAQRSIDRGSSDAFMNLTCAVSAAAQFEGAGVYTCMHGTSSDDHCILIRGTKVRKMHTSRRDAFRPINELPIAKVFKDGKIEITNKNFRKREKEKTEVDNKFEEKTAIVSVYPGMDPKVIDFYVKEGYKGLVLAATALGHVPTNNPRNIIANLENAIKKGVSVVIATQTLYGRTHPYVYTNLRKLSVQLGCIFAEDMLPETAYVKLGWVLAHTTKPDEVRKLMLENIAGEINPIIDEKAFLN